MVYTEIYSPPEVKRRQILRYAGARDGFDGMEELLDECLGIVLPKTVYKVCWCEIPLVVYDGGVDLGFMKTNSKGLAKNLKNCTSAVVFAATIGIETDRLISRYAAVSPVKSLMFQAIGAERIESLCDIFNAEVSARKAYTRSRFSPGYGDFSLEAQRDIFRVLEPSRKIGLNLNDSFLMSPSKSVTAIIGVSDSKQE